MNYTKLRNTLGLVSRKALALLTCFSLVGTFTPTLALAASNNQDVQTSWYGALANANIKLGGAVASTNNGSAVSTTTTIMNLTYSGTAASAMVTIGTTCITFYAPQGTVDTTIGNATCGFSGGTFDMSVSTGNTLGQLCDLINGVQGPFTLSGNANGGAPSGGNYHCTLTGGIRSDTPLNYLPVVTQAANVNSLNAVGGYNVPTSTQALISLGIIPAAGRHVVLNYCTANSPGTPSVEVHGVRAKFGIGSGGVDLDEFGNPMTDSSLVYYGPALVANTTRNEPIATPIAQPWIEFAGRGSDSYALNNPPGHAPNPPVGNNYNGHVVVRVNNYGTGVAAAAATNFLSCNWLEKTN